MHDFRILKLLDYFRGFFEKLKIDYPVLRDILTIKLLMDERRVLTIFDEATEQKQNSFMKSLWIYFLYGFILVYFVFGDTYILQVSIMFGIALFILMTALIADFSPVMLDTRDRTIMGTKPVDDRTIGVAKLIHILIYLIQITGAFTIIPIIVMLFVQGIQFTILFIVMLCFFMLLIITATSLIYMVVLKWFSGDRLKSMINYIQIVFAIGIIIGYQMIIRSYGLVDLHSDYIVKAWHVLLPPMWFAAPFDLILNQNIEIEVIILSLLAIIVPIIAFLIYYASIPMFESHLQKLLATTQTRKNRMFSLGRLWKILVCRTEQSRAYFQFVYKIIDREREFKLKVYPSLGIGLVLPFIFIFTEAGFRSITEVQNGYFYLCIYLMHIFIGIAIYTFQFSGHYKGAWVFTASGNLLSSELYKAVIKVFLVKLYLPMFVIVGIPYYLFFQQFHLIDLAIVLISAVIQTFLSYQISVTSTFPFSLPFDKAENETLTKAALLMLVTVPFVGFHLLSNLVPFVSYGYFILLCIAAYLLWRYFGRVTYYMRQFSQSV